jgi:MoaA/NifB/PqqE/SkfB family radical SAM enzyme
MDRKEIHDDAVARPGTYDIAIKAIKAAKAKGFRVYTNTTIFDGSKAEDFHGFFDYRTTS